MQTTFEPLKLAGTAVISDVFDSLHLLPPVFDNRLQPIGTSSTFAGPAYTITGEPIQFEGGDRAKLSAIDAMPAGIVAVWSSMDAKGVCCFGDLLASAMRARGCVAAVVDGGVRDASFLEQCGMPVVARYKTPAQGIGRSRHCFADRSEDSRSSRGVVHSDAGRHHCRRCGWSHRDSRATPA